MHKLIILVEPLEDWAAFEQHWPQFLHLAEQMPGLRRETTSRVEQAVYGTTRCAFIHELYFESLGALQQAMISLQGLEAGRLLQKITQGRMTLLFADHNEDELENIHRYRKQEDEHQPAADAG